MFYREQETCKMFDQRNNLTPLTCVHFIIWSKIATIRKRKEQIASPFMLLAGVGWLLPTPLCDKVYAQHSQTQPGGKSGMSENMAWGSRVWSTALTKV